MRNLLIIGSGLTLSLLVASCDKHPKKAVESDSIHTADGQRVILPNPDGDISRDPTNPEGGLIPGRNPDLSVEESVARQKKNIILPILYPTGAAGITMKTPRSEVMKILSNPEFIAPDGYIVYPENIAIDWLPDMDDPTPAGIFINEGYKGTLELPAPLGTLRAGDMRPEFVKNPDESLLSIGTVLAKAEAGYDCEIAGTCYYFKNTDGTHFFLYAEGGFLFNADGKLKQIRINSNQWPKRSKDLMVYGESIGGISLTSKRADVEARLGVQMADADGVVAYDDGSINIVWGEDGTPASIQALRGHKGKLEIATDRFLMLGDPFAELSSEKDDGKELMVALDRILAKRAEGFDCSAQKVPACTFKLEGNLLEIKLEKATYYFLNNAAKTWVGVELTKK